MPSEECILRDGSGWGLPYKGIGRERGLNRGEQSYATVYRLVNEGAIVKPSVAEAVLLNGELESRTVKVTLVVPLVSGVPRMLWEAGSKVSPKGMATGCQTRGGKPPTAVNVVTGYGTFTRPTGRDVVLTNRGGSTVRESDFCTVSAGLEESWSVKV